VRDSEVSSQPIPRLPDGKIDLTARGRCGTSPTSSATAASAGELPRCRGIGWLLTSESRTTGVPD